MDSLNFEKYYGKNYTSSLEIHYSEFSDEGYWNYKYAKGWDCMGSSSGGGSRNYVNECTTYGPVEYLKEELTNTVNYLKARNQRGVGRYIIIIKINPLDKHGDYEDHVYKSYVKIDDNRELDKHVWKTPYNPRARLMNFNFKDNSDDYEGIEELRL